MKGRLFLLLTILSICTLLFIPFIFAYYKKVSIANSAKSARQNSELNNQSFIDNQSNHLKVLNVIDDEIASSKTDICYLHNSKSGFSVKSTSQKCYIRYTKGFKTKLSKTEVTALLRSSNQTDLLFGKPQNIGCTIYQLNSTANSVLTFREPAMPHEVNVQYPYCEIPEPFSKQTVNKYGYFGTVYHNSYYTYNEAKISTDSNQVWLVVDAPYFQKQIQCGWNIICSLMLNKPSNYK